MQLRIVHDTHYAYASAVVTAQHLAHLHPLNLPDQTLQFHRLSIWPTPQKRHCHVDVFGNERCFFSLESPHTELRVRADSLLHTALPRGLNGLTSIPWEQVREQFRYQIGTPFDPASSYVFASPFVPRSALLAEFASVVFTPERPLLDATQALMTRIHTEMTYASGSTGIYTPALTALAQRRGVCQDFAHIMIGCLRSLGLPARYVSGYLLTQPPQGHARLIGADASHAWVQGYDPHLGWLDFDPTNNRSGWGRPGADYATLALGRDFGDVSPLRGVIQGGGYPRLSVAVTVAPPEEWPIPESWPPY
jgi:transglutaminase-like putative cysteine protease